MAGGVMQLVAYGVQDVYLTGNPQITYWKVIYKRHTNFACEPIEQSFSGTADFGKTSVTATVARNGDLMSRVYLRCKVQLSRKAGSSGKFAWVRRLGHSMIREVSCQIGGATIDRQTGDWMNVWHELARDSNLDVGYSEMIGDTPHMTELSEDEKSATLYVPLTFWFCRNPGLALPLIALQYHEVKINLELSPMDRCLWAGKKSGSNYEKYTSAYNTPLANASLYVDYIFLDTDERRRMAQNPHEYLIEQLQFTGEESVGSSSNKIKLNFNHPCKELVWTVQKDSVVQECDNFEDDKLVCKARGAQYFNYTDAVDALPNSLKAFTKVSDGTGLEMNELIESDGDLVNTDVGEGKVSDAAAFVVSEKALDMHCWGQNPVVTAKLQLNGQDRFSEREGSYFDLVQPWQHHTRHPDTGINVYSFALRPEEHQPSGTCNFSRIDNATLHLTLSAHTLRQPNDTANSSDPDTAKVRVYAVNYNVLRIMSGMGGLAYSN